MRSKQNNLTRPRAASQNPTLPAAIFPSWSPPETPAPEPPPSEHRHSYSQLEQHAARQTAALRESEERYRTLVEMSPDAILIQRDDCIVFNNTAARRLFHVPEAARLTGRSIFELFHPDYHPLIRDRLRRMAESGRPASLAEEKVVCLDGAVREVEVAACRFVDSHGPAVQVVLHDITDRRRLEREILKVVEREQERIGQDLHDGLCHMLVAAKYRIALLERMLMKNAPAAARQARALERELGQAIEQARGLARGLNPVSLKANGLTRALEELAAGVASAGVRCQCRFANAAPEPEHSVASHLYRIAQEAVQNAVRHARPANIWIELRTRPNALGLIISDDGSGLPRGRRKTGGAGLHNMHARASVIGATLEIRRRRERGTTVACWLSGPGRWRSE